MSDEAEEDQDLMSIALALSDDSPGGPGEPEAKAEPKPEAEAEAEAEAEEIEAYEAPAPPPADQDQDLDAAISEITETYNDSDVNSDAMDHALDKVEDQGVRESVLRTAAAQHLPSDDPIWILVDAVSKAARLADHAEKSVEKAIERVRAKAVADVKEVAPAAVKSAIQDQVGQIRQQVEAVQTAAGKIVGTAESDLAAVKAAARKEIETAAQGLDRAASRMAERIAAAANRLPWWKRWGLPAGLAIAVGVGSAVVTETINRPPEIALWRYMMIGINAASSKTAADGYTVIMNLVENGRKLSQRKLR